MFFCVFVAVKVLFEMYWIIKLYRLQLVSVQHSARCASIHQPNRQHPPTSANVCFNITQIRLRKWMKIRFQSSASIPWVQQKCCRKCSHRGSNGHCERTAPLAQQALLRHWQRRQPGGLRGILRRQVGFAEEEDAVGIRWGQTKQQQKGIQGKSIGPEVWNALKIEQKSWSLGFGYFGCREKEKQWRGCER